MASPTLTTLRRFFAWFSFDPVRYLQRGDNENGFRDKLDRFLVSQNKDPATWPHAYLLSVPRFLWWERNVVSFWYLYSESHELSAMIMEINNSFDEKRNVLFELQPESDKPVDETDDSTKKPKYLDKKKNVLSLPSFSSGKFYKGVWKKDIFASPFEKVEGSISTRFADPLNASLSKSTAFMARVASVGLTGKSKMVTTINYRESPIDPTNVSTIHLAKSIFLWTFPGTLTTPRIIFQALKIQNHQGLMQMMDRPMIRPGSIARHPTAIERELEPFWRAFMSQCVDNFPHPLELTYIPSASISNEHVCLLSPSARIESNETTQRLTVEAVDPGFYSRVVNCADLWEGISHEQQQEGSCADTTSSPLAVSDALLLHTLITTFQKKILPAPVRSFLSLGNVLAVCRGSEAQMDSFVLSSTPPFVHSRYTECVIKMALASRFSVSSQPLLWVYGVLARYMLLEMVTSICFMWGVVTAYAPIASIILYLTMWNIGYVVVGGQLFPSTI
ncbi:unnamed protein product [Penicillium glandicola]